MAERATGPVKPPVIDLTARSGSRADAEAQATSTEGTAGSAHRADASATLRTGRADWPLLGGVAAGGAVLGTALTYLLAFALPLPSHQTDLSATVAAQQATIETLGSTVAGLQASTKNTQISLDATIAQLDAGLTDAKQAIADVRAAIPPAQAAVDLAPLETELKTLKAQVDAIASGASGGDAGAIAQSLSSLDASVASLTARLNGLDSTIGTMRSDLDATRKALADHIDTASSSEVGPALKLPLILSGLEGAFATGKPFAAELTSLGTVMPSLVVPDVLKSAASTGLARPETLLQQFETALPAVLAARDTSGADWGATALDWAKSLLALRPAAEMTGDSLDAIISRLEGAMGRRDYAAASALIGQLPPAMRDAAGPIASDIAAHAAADAFVADLRTKALATSEAAP